MTNSQLYQSIFQRKSIRKYDLTPLDTKTLTDIKEYANHLAPVDKSIQYQLSFLNANDVKNLFPIKAPHYVCIHSEKKDGYLLNAGFLLQQMDLFFSANNLASCWLGMAKPTKEIPDVNNMEYVIMIAFGKSPEKVHRTNVSEFKRKGLSAITNVTGMDDIFESIRIAPSANNSQPWFISGTTDELIISRESLNFIKAPLLGKTNQIDIGIALCHLWLALDHKGKKATFDLQKQNAPKGYEFMIKVKVN
jgi:nitroreductase